MTCEKITEIAIPFLVNHTHKKGTEIVREAALQTILIPFFIRITKTIDIML